MCNHVLNKRGSHSKDALLGMEECQSPFGIYELKIPVDKDLACDTNRFTTTNCKDLDVSNFLSHIFWHSRMYIIARSGLLLTFFVGSRKLQNVVFHFHVLLRTWKTQMHWFEFKSLTKVGIAACRLPLAVRRREWRKGWVGVGRGLTKTLHLPLLTLKRKKKRKEIQSALSKKDALRTGPYCLS